MSDVLCKHALCPDTQTAFCYLFKRPMFLCPMFCVSMRYVRTRKPPFVICLNHKTADVKSTSVQCSLATSRATVVCVCVCVCAIVACMHCVCLNVRAQKLIIIIIIFINEDIGSRQQKGTFLRVPPLSSPCYSSASSFSAQCRRDRHAPRTG